MKKINEYKNFCKKENLKEFKKDSLDKFYESLTMKERE